MHRDLQSAPRLFRSLRTEQVKPPAAERHGNRRHKLSRTDPRIDRPCADEKLPRQLLRAEIIAIFFLKTHHVHFRNLLDLLTDPIHLDPLATHKPSQGNRRERHIL